jgi:hypothetical protein
MSTNQLYSRKKWRFYSARKKRIPDLLLTSFPGLIPLEYPTLGMLLKKRGIELPFQ